MFVVETEEEASPKTEMPAEEIKKDTDETAAEEELNEEASEENDPEEKTE